MHRHQKTQKSSGFIACRDPGTAKKVKEKPTNKKIVCDRRLGQKVLCYKHAFSRELECTVAYCDSCKNLMCLEDEGRGGGRHRGDGDDRVGIVVMKCNKGD